MPSSPAAAIPVSPRALIARIDRQIDDNRRVLRHRERIATMSVMSVWHRAWERQPFLRDRENALFRQRGLLQLERDAAEERTARIVARRSRKCPTCGAHTLTVSP